MIKVKTDNPNYVKDLSNSAILAHDRQALINHRKKLSESQQINNIRSEMNDLKNKVDLILLHLQDMRGSNA